MSPPRREKSIFLAALEHVSPHARAAYLEDACRGDEALRQAVEDLLAAYGRAGDLLDDDDVACVGLRRRLEEAAGVLGLDEASALPSEDPSSGHVGELVGPYRLMERIGEGGFGEVYVAAQEEPVRRHVALKLLKAGMSSRDVIARFEAERQALAMMDSPHIARVFDAGTTSTGQPYFVMELVRGVPITVFCEERRLPICKRLELFMDVCHGVQHAHQKGVIHRDLKPSNVLATLHDVTTVVKVIDFGVAKAIEEPLTDKTIYTRFAQMIGTPMYMSPEQAEMNALDVDTRSDIYSLGVILYELVTGTTPFEERRLHTATFDELRHIIRAEEPPRPSVRLVSQPEAATAKTAANRCTDPRALTSLLRGDLDWIVMKALEKDRRRRYDTAADLARDVERHIHHQPVIARAPSAWYRLQKLAQRNKVAFTTASLVLLALVAGTAVSTWQAIVARRAQAEAELLRQEATEFADRLKEANVLLDSARANADERRWSLAWSEYTRAAELQPDHYVTWTGRGSLYARVGAWNAAAADFARALHLGAAVNNPGWWGVPQLCVYAGEDEAYRLAIQTLERQREKATDDAMLTVVEVRSLLVRPRPREEALELAARLERVPARPPRSARAPPRPPEDRRRPPPEGGPDRRPGFRRPGRVPSELLRYASGLAYFRAGETERALQQLTEVVEADSGVPVGGVALPALALAYAGAGRTAEAVEALSAAREAIAAWLAVLEGGNPQELRVPWFDIVECLVLYREARESIAGAPPALATRLKQVEEHALALLRGA